jgi:hypothetical protein
VKGYPYIQRVGIYNRRILFPYLEESHVEIKKASARRRECMTIMPTTVTTIELFF